MTGPEASDETTAACLVALALLPGIGPATLLRCHREEGAVEAWDALVTGRPTRIGALAALRGPGRVGADRLVAAARRVEPASELALHRAGGQEVAVLGGAGYPPRLLTDPAPPAVLFLSGSVDALTRPTVALVGTRNATRAGRDLARSLGVELAAAGVAVVSGLALGIDGAAHEGALRALGSSAAEGREGVPTPGVPVGVVAAGLDLVYPRRHRDLHRNVAAAGLLLSETPLGIGPAPWRFPARNRLIAGLSDAVVVVESRTTGGSILTASEALERGTPVLAVPGHPSSPTAAGTNDLLFDGATIARSALDVLDVLGISPGPTGPVGSDDGSLAVDQRAVLATLNELPAALPVILSRSGLDLEVVSAALVVLEARGLVVRSGPWYERCER